MVIGCLTLGLRIASADTLKDKRQVLKGLIESTRRKFNVAIAEVDDMDMHRSATVGIVTVSNDGVFANQVLSKVLDTIEANPEVEVVGVSLELL